MIDHSKILKMLFAVQSQPSLAANLKISRQAVWQWRRVPVERAREIWHITGIPLNELRPDIWDPQQEAAG